VVSYTAVSPLLRFPGAVCFLLRSLSGPACADLPGLENLSALSTGTLPCEVRTFLCRAIGPAATAHLRFQRMKDSMCLLKNTLF